MTPPTKLRLVRVISLRQHEDELIDRIDGMLKAGELKHAPPDYWAARTKLLRRRAAARRRAPGARP